MPKYLIFSIILSNSLSSNIQRTLNRALGVQNIAHAFDIYSLLSCSFRVKYKSEDFCHSQSDYAIDIKKINEFKHAMIYISKELAKVVYNYEDHSLGRIWGSSRDLRTKPKIEINCTYKNFRELLSTILEKKILNNNGETQLMAMKDFAIDSNLWINFEEIKYEILNWQKNNSDPPDKKYSEAYKKIVMRKYSFKE